MQCPPTRPGVKLRKFHLVAAAESTSFVSMSSAWKMAESSFMNAMLRSRCAFSITLAASATLIDGALQASRDDRTVNRCDDIEGPRILTGHDLFDGLEPMRLVAGVDPFVRIATREITARRQTRSLLEDRHAIFLRRAGIDRGFVDDDVALFQS